MTYLESYKELDRMCKDILQSETGVSTYIQYMEDCRDGNDLIPDFDSDRKRLKHYRHIRNKIAHEPHINESSLYGKKDIKWLADFKQRIADGTDPLALYIKHKRQSKAKRTKETPKKQTDVKITKTKKTYYFGKFTVSVFRFLFDIMGIKRKPQ